MANCAIIVIAADAARGSVDIDCTRPAQGGKPSIRLRFRLIEAADRPMLTLDLNHLAGVSPADGAGPPRPRIIALPLRDPGPALDRALPEPRHRETLLEALQLCLDHWRPGTEAGLAARLRDATAEALAAATPPKPRLAGSTAGLGAGNATRPAETSIEALFRALHFCRRRLDASA